MERERERKYFEVLVNFPEQTAINCKLDLLICIYFLLALIKNVTNPESDNNTLPKRNKETSLSG